MAEKSEVILLHLPVVELYVTVRIGPNSYFSSTRFFGPFNTQKDALDWVPRLTKRVASMWGESVSITKFAVDLEHRSAFNSRASDIVSPEPHIADISKRLPQLIFDDVRKKYGYLNQK